MERLMPQTIRIKPETRQKLQMIAKEESTPMTKMLDRVVDAYQRQKLLEATNAAYAALRANPKAWEQELAERRLWDATLSDGLKGE
jgi:hypothetical protein